ncbi:SDR family NAD(P)-dependent oxidoreductase [Microseira sp. BLCC-F43]|jgi:acyl transferase domain-containing protein|uniref:SDR family NAD(P)-dependent oxidoreductase n=1 Tax=Microseira sp. BLCC-F43 TaxID=3153602 RepID=UPI0035B86EEA
MEPIAIIGIGCRFPSAKDPESFWYLLQNGLHGITEVPPNRWNKDVLYDPTPATPGKMNTRWGAFLQEIDLFDPEFFRISPREAVSVDPQHRLILEVAWEALENAGIVPESLEDSQTGVFLGIVGSDYGRLVFSDPQSIDAYGGTGVTPSIAANRLSYLLNLHGPSLVIDTACSSSLVALHFACQSLQSGESNLCLVGGVNLTLSPEYTLAFSQARMMAGDGLCKTFDAAANGYVRGEGCGIIAIERLSDAIQNEDNILAVIRGSAVNHDGFSNGITAPNGCSQQAVMSQALKNAGIAPAQISYVEAHGTGTSLGDPIEVESIQAVFGNGRTPEQHCWIGSVKTNIGHLEAAAGIAGLIKVVLSLHHRQIPPHLHLKQLNPLIKLAGTPFSIPTECQSWSVVTGSRMAGVSSFSFGGTNCHVILEEAPKQVAKTNEIEGPLHLFTLSAQTKNALLELVSHYQSYLETHRALAISSVCFSANTGRSHFQHRLAIVTSNREELANQLAKISAGEEANDVFSGKIRRNNQSPKIAFLFTGQGSQYVNMGRQLYKTQPVFRRTLDQCDQILQSYLKKSILDILYPQDSQQLKSSVIDQTVYTQATVFALEYALAQLWQSWGIKPNAVMGHSVGEYVAATIAGVLSLEDGLKLIAHRGRLMQQLDREGKMLAVMASEEEIRPLIASYPTEVAIAAINGPQNLVISGQTEAIKILKTRLESQGIQTKLLQVSHAFHSPLMEPILAEFEAVAHQITYNRPRIPLISNVTGSRADDTITTASYWVNHIRQPVKFAQSMKTLHQEGYKIFLEIGAKPILIAMGKQCLPEGVGVWLPSLHPSQEDWQQMLQSLGKLYVQGVKVDWSGFERDYARSKVRLPTYPFQRQRYWIETNNHHLSSQQKSLSNQENLHPLLGQRLYLAGLDRQIRFECLLSPSQPSYLKDHCIFSQPILPAAAYLEMILAAGSNLLKSDNFTLEDIQIEEALILDEIKTIQVILNPEKTQAYSFEIFSSDFNYNHSEPIWTLHVQGKLRAGGQNAPRETTELKNIQSNYNQEISVQKFYQTLKKLGIDYGSNYQAVQKLWCSTGKALGQVQLPETLVSEARKYQLHPVLLDASLQVLAAALGETDAQETYLPVAIKRLKMYRTSSTGLWSRVEIKANREERVQTLTGEVHLFSDEGQLIATVEGLTVKRVTAQALARNHQEFIQDWFYEVKWRTKVFFSQQSGGNYLPTPDEIDLKLRPQVTHLLAQPDFKRYKEVLTQLETLSINYVLKAFQELGWNFQVGESFSRSFIIQKLGIVQPHQKLLGRLLEMLCEVGILKPIDSEWEVTQVPLVQNPEILFSSLLSQYPSASTELMILKRCASQLASVLRGESEPAQLVFPEGDLSNVTQLYQDSSESKVMNTLVQQAVLSALEKLPKSRGVRVLEIGAGTGGTTAYILPHLNPNQTEYVFTDIGSWFITKAQEKFKDYPFVRYQNLDIEQDPSTQGFELHQYDLIIAANVLHATQDLRQTLQQVRKLLAPQGILILLETTIRQRGLDLIFGLLEGWWRFRDLDLRPDYPLLSAQKWQQLLQKSGFQQTVSIPELQENHVALSRQAVILAQVAAPPLSNTQSESIGHWLIFADTVVGENLAQQLQQQGGECTLVYRGDSYQKLDKGYQVNPSHPQEFEQLIQSIQENSNFPLKKIIHLWSLDTPDPQELTIATLKSIQRWGCGSVLHLVKALIKTKPMPKLWLVTRGSQSILSKTEPVSVAASPLWGMGRVVSLEHPQMWGGLVDLDPQSAASETETLLKLLADRDQPEDHLAIRGEDIYVARLVQQSFNPSQPLSLESNATYLITGGLGALGLHTAKWMVEKNARHLVLIGRTQPSQEQREAINHLEQQGAKVIVAQADVSNFEELAKVFEQIDSHLPPLKGIVHGAGIGAFQLIEQMTLTQLEEVMTAKVIGGWILHQLTRDRELDFFVSFSSMTAVWGAIGQAHYAASNCFLDGLTYYRQAKGLPSFSINWGPWFGGGMAGEQELREARKIGVAALSPQQGIAALEQLWRSGHIQTTVANVNWNLFKQLYQIERKRLLIEEIEVKTLKNQQEKSQHKAEILQLIKSSPPPERENILLAYLQDEISQVLRKRTEQIDVQQPLNTMGIDSLMALDLRNRLKTALTVDVPLVKFIEDTSIADLVAKVLVAEVNEKISKNAPVQRLESENTEINLFSSTEDNDWIEGEL